MCITAKSLTDEFIFRILKKQILWGVFVSEYRLMQVKTYLVEELSFHLFALPVALLQRCLPMFKHSELISNRKITFYANILFVLGLQEDFLV